MSLAAPPDRPLRVVFSSHDGLGLGHVRRNARIAAALTQLAPAARVTLVTGVGSQHAWLGADGTEVVRVPALTKDGDGRYRNPDLDLDAALARRSAAFAEVIERVRPDVVVVDRHPFGIGGELRAGLALARRAGAAIVLGLRDILDEPAAVRAELAGPGWAGAGEIVDEVLVYGQPDICDHRAEYGLPTTPTYCGVVTGLARHTGPVTDRGLLVLSAGSGADGQAVLALAGHLAAHPSVARTLLVSGPAAALARADLDPRVEVVSGVHDCSGLYAVASASLQMAGYNSTYEAIAAGLRPILVPRRTPRREQAIRAARLASLGLADVVDAHAHPDEVLWLLDRPRRLSRKALRRSGLSLGGAERAARCVSALAGFPVVTQAQSA